MVHALQCEECKAVIQASDHASAQGLLDRHAAKEHGPKLDDATKAYIAKLEANQQPEDGVPVRKGKRKKE